jgi:Domain of unknown function (DUF4158)
MLRLYDTKCPIKSQLLHYARRPQTSTDHAREVASALGLRPPIAADLSLMVEAAARAAWATDKGLPIALGIIEALRAERILLPAPAVIERVGLAGRARARRRDSRRASRRLVGRAMRSTRCIACGRFDKSRHAAGVVESHALSAERQPCP